MNIEYKIKEFAHRTYNADTGYDAQEFYRQFASELVKELIPEKKKKSLPGLVMTFFNGEKEEIPLETNYDAGFNDCVEVITNKAKEMGIK